MFAAVQGFDLKIASAPGIKAIRERTDPDDSRRLSMNATERYSTVCRRTKGVVQRLERPTVVAEVAARSRIGALPLLGRPSHANAILFLRAGNLTTAGSRH